MLNIVKENIKKIYGCFDLDDSIIDAAINSTSKKDLNKYLDLIFETRKCIEYYLIEKCKNDIDLEILLLEKYKNAMLTIMNIYKLDETTARQIYELSFELMIENYDKSNLIYNNLSKIMKKQIKEKIYGINISNEEKTVIVDDTNTKEDEQIIDKKQIQKQEDNNEKIEEKQDDMDEKYDYSNILKYINNKHFFELLKDKMDNEFEYLIAQLLFGYYGKYYDIKSISEFFDISNINIYEIYMKVLNIYKELFYDWYNYQLSLGLKNE